MLMWLFYIVIVSITNLQSFPLLQSIIVIVIQPMMPLDLQRDLWQLSISAWYFSSSLYGPRSWLVQCKRKWHFKFFVRKLVQLRKDPLYNNASWVTSDSEGHSITLKLWNLTNHLIITLHKIKPNFICVTLNIHYP